MDVNESKITGGAAANINSSDSKDWVENFARFGVAAKGVVYCLIGGLTAMAAFGMGGQISGGKGIMQWILEQPFGRIILGAVALGLFGYVIWRGYQAIKDPDHEGDDAKGVAKRLGYGWSGLIYAALATYAAILAIQGAGGGSSGGSSKQQLVGKVLSWNGGEWIIGVAGAITILVGIYQIFKALTGKYKKGVNISSMDETKRKLYMRAGKVGYIARGIVWGIIGYLFIQAAMNSSASQAGGTTSAFQFLQNSSYGPWLMGVVALGLVCYGIYCFVKAKYRTFTT